MIRIRVSDVTADVTYINKPYKDGWFQYDVITSYEVSFAIEFERGNMNIQFPLCNKKHFEYISTYSIEDELVQKPNNNFFINKDRPKTIEEVVLEWKERLNKTADFIPDFNYLLMQRVKERN